MTDRRWLYRTLVWVALGVVTLWASPAHAQVDKVEQARTFFNAGAKAYKAGKYLVAVKAFEQAYRIVPREGLLFSTAQAYRRQFHIDRRPEHLQAAIQKYREYVQRAPSGNRRGEADEALTELQKEAQKLGADVPEGEEGQPQPAPPPLEVKTYIAVSTVPKGARVLVDAKPVSADTPAVEVAPGIHRITVTAAGYFDEQREVPVPEGAMAAVHVKLREKPAQVTVNAEDGAEIYLDGRPAGVTPLPAPLELPAGEHLLGVAHNGRDGYAEELVLSRGQRRQLDIRLDDTAQRITSYVFFGIAGASAVAGGVFTGIALHHQSNAKEIQSRAEEGNIPIGDLQTYNDALERRDTWRGAAGLAFAGVALAGVTGLFLFMFDEPSIEAPARREKPDREQPGDEEPAVPTTMEISGGPVWLPGGAGAALVGRF